MAGSPVRSITEETEQSINEKRLLAAIKRKNRNSWDSSNCGLAEILIDEGCDVNARTVDGFSPLHLALKAKNDSVVKILIDLGADMNAEVADKSALHFAIERTSFCSDFSGNHYCHYKGTAYLLEVGVDVFDNNIRDKLEVLLKCKNIRMTLAKFGHAKLAIPKAFGSPTRFIYATRENNLGTKFHQESQSEVEKMKKLDIGGKSLYDLLHFKLERRVHWVQLLEKLPDIVKSSNLKSDFPHYCYIIKGKYMQAVERRALLEPAQNALRQITDIPLPDICVESIFRYLDNQCLRAIIKVVYFNTKDQP